MACMLELAIGFGGFIIGVVAGALFCGMREPQDPQDPQELLSDD